MEVITRPLTDKEKEIIQQRLDSEKARLAALTFSISDLEQRLHNGTVWTFDPEEYTQAGKKIKEEVAAWKKLSDDREIAEYGRTLTVPELQGWTDKPKSAEGNK